MWQYSFNVPTFVLHNMSYEVVSTYDKTKVPTYNKENIVLETLASKILQSLRPYFSRPPKCIDMLRYRRKSCGGRPTCRTMSSMKIRPFSNECIWEGVKKTVRIIVCLVISAIKHYDYGNSGELIREPNVGDDYRNMTGSRYFHYILFCTPFACVPGRLFARACSRIRGALFGKN